MRESPAWTKAVSQEDFTAIPAPLGFSLAVHLSHRMDVYRLHGSLAAVAAIAGEAHQRGRPWRGTAMELWTALFFMHRASRHGGTSNEDDGGADLNALAETLRQRLLAAHGAERAEIMNALAEGPAFGRQAPPP